MIHGIDPKVDFAFKFLFGQEENKPLLIDLLNAVLAPAPDAAICEVDLLNPFNDRRFACDKMSILDIKARDGKGRLFNIEMQVKDEGDFEKRFLYHGTRVHQSQMLEGDRYADLKPTILIGFLDYVQFANRKECQLEFGLIEKNLHFPMTGDLVFHFFQLPRFAKTAGELETALDKWLYFLRHADKMDREALPDTMREPPLVRAMGVLEMVTQADLDRQAYEDAWKRKMDYNSYIKPLVDEGVKQGEIKLVRVLQNLLDLPLSNPEELQLLTLEQLAGMAEQLQVKLRNRG